MKDRNTNLNKKLKIVFVVVLILLIAVMIASVIFYRSTLSGKNLPDVGEILAYHGSELIKEEKSSEKDFSYDIYAKLKFPPIEENGYAEETFYDNLITDLTAKLQTNFRIIDEEKDVVVRVKYDFTTYNSYYSINNIDNYFKVQQAKVQSQIAKTQISELYVNTNVLQSIINSNWERRKASLGTSDSSINKYDIYFDEGYYIKTLGTKIFNIVFTNKFNGQVVNGITTGMTNEEIIRKIGEPTFSYSNNKLIGYKSNDFYAFFCNGEISIYEVAKLNEQNNQTFAQLFTKLNKDGDVTSFYNSLNIVYPNPEISTEKGNDILLFYPTLGMKVHFGKDNNGITLYSNYLGFVTTDKTIDDIKNGDVTPNTDLDLSNDAVFLSERTRYLDDIEKRTPNNSWAKLSTKNYQIYENEVTHCYEFYSIDKKSIDSSITKNSGMNILSIDDNRFVYSIPFNGIYTYNAQTVKTDKILNATNDEELKLEKVQDNILYYDNKTMPIG